MSLVCYITINMKPIREMENIFCFFLFLLSKSVVSLDKGNITKNELHLLTEELFESDVNNAGHLVVISPQGRVDPYSATDSAPYDLLSVDKRVYQIPTISKLIQLYDNYNPDVKQHEIITSSEKQEENEFLNSVLNTSVMRKAKEWLGRKGLTPFNNEDFKTFLKNLWFGIYSRQKQAMGSSAFEHIFLGEVKNNQVSGFHNWIYFSYEENKRKVNYLGWTKKVNFKGNKGGILKLLYTWGNVSKPVGSMFVGTSPEFELALYTICFLVRPNSLCPISLGGKTLNIQTHVLSQKNQNYIGSAFPKL